MKKIAILLSALLMLCSFVGCSGSGSQTGGGASSGGAASAQADSDVEYVKGKGTLIVGITDFAPMDYRESDGGEWIGFDADMAKAFAEELGVEAEFLEIANWDMKSVELETKAVDVVWNGMTLTDDVKELMGTSEPYCKNMQVAVMKASKAADYQTTDDLKNLTFAAEHGSAGAEALDALGISYTEVDSQAKALMEVDSGSVDACVIDLLMAGAMVGEGTSYPDLVMSLSVSDEEEYGVGFRKDSDLVAAFNAFWKKAYDAGTVMEKVEAYGIAQNIIAK